MTLYFLQSSPPPPPGGADGSPAWMVVAIIPVLMVIIGMVLGFRALNDIRLAEGRLGGAVCATLAAGLIPSAVIIIACGAGMVLLAEEVLPRGRAQNDVWPTTGGIIGLWLSFLMLRGMWRQATGWVRPAPQEGKRSQLTVAAIVLTIAGGALMLVLLTVSPARAFSMVHTLREVLLLVDLVILVAGLTCGVLARGEKAARVCAWTSGVLFVLLVLLFLN